MTANLNKHGAWIYTVWNGPAIRNRKGEHGAITEHRAFATVDGAAKYMHEKLVKSGLIPLECFEEWSGLLAKAEVGTVDCFHSLYPIVWYDHEKDEGEFEVDDYEDWEEAVESLRRRKLEVEGK